MSESKRERKEMSDLDFLYGIDFESPSVDESSPQAKKRKKVVWGPVRTPSDPIEDVMQIEEQERVVSEHDDEVKSLGMKLGATYRRDNEDKNVSRHGYSKTHWRDINVKLWTERDEKKNAIKDQQYSKNFVKNNKKNYEWIKELISTNQITPDYPMKMNGQEATAKDFIDMYENHEISAVQKEGGKKNKKNRKTKRKSKRKNKRKTLSKKSKRKSKRKTSNKKSKH